MAKNKNRNVDIPIRKVSYNLPKGSLAKINLGQSFAEYDSALKKPNVFVETPAIRAALSDERAKCFYVGRRGTGKTTVSLYLSEKFEKNTTTILPQLFSEIEVPGNLDDLRDTRQRPFKSLVSCFKRALLNEVLGQWLTMGHVPRNRLAGTLCEEIGYVDEFDFDLRMLEFSKGIFTATKERDEREWLRLINRPKEIAAEMIPWRDKNRSQDVFVLIDRIDESWDGSDKAVIILMALMHACVELANPAPFLKPMLFLRENIFERVRQIDNEFARLETWVISVDWSKQLLLELIERRLNVPFVAKIPLGGETWDYFFEKVDGESSQSIVLNYCQERPRDVLTYCGFALESAQSKKQEIIKIEDLQTARRRFSDSRPKDLGDEYQENFPQIQLILSRFYGLGTEYTVHGIASFIQKLLVDDEVKQHCAKWIYDYTSPDRFSKLLYDIGFFGIREKELITYRTTGAQSPVPPPISTDTNFVIHPSYADALSLQEVLIDKLDPATDLRHTGLLTDIPDSIKLDEYQDRLRQLIEEIKTLPTGDDHAKQYEDIIGELLRLCFFRTLANVEAQVRDYENRVIRDWIVSNRAKDGFWEMVRQRHRATQVIWECKNYSDLQAGDFHQAAYYMTNVTGQFLLICFRGEVKKHHYKHVRGISGEKDGGVVLLLTDKDLLVFLRQALNGKTKDDHIQELYDGMIRKIS